MSERWVPVVGYEGLYEVSDCGRVRAVWAGKPKLRKCPVNYNGYHAVGLRKEGKTRIKLVHRLMLSAFVRPAQLNEEGLHRNGVRTDNRLSNIHWGDKSENMYDSVQHGTHNMARKTHCINGHLYSDENTFMRVRPPRRNPIRVCLTCQQERARAYYVAKRATASPELAGRLSDTPDGPPLSLRRQTR